ncbi:hypothetical protein D3C72_2372190 [compost metagenome]
MDTYIKGKEHFEQLGPWYLARIVGGLLIAVVAMRTDSSRKIMWLGVVWLFVNALWITAIYSDLF